MKNRHYIAWGIIGCLLTSNIVGCGTNSEVKAHETAETVNQTTSLAASEDAREGAQNITERTKETAKLNAMPIGDEASELKEAQKSYITALQYAVEFYDANKCGKDVATNNVFDWRKACHTKDGSDVGLDLSGGYHDCGDHVKFGITQGYAAGVLGWSYYQNRSGFVQAGIEQKTLSVLKHFSDYLLKCHPSADVYYYQVGDANEDHAYWGKPESQGDRKVIYKVDQNTAGSDVAGQASAALSLMYLNYKEIDEAYAAKCLKAAKSLYALGNQNYGVSQGQGCYNSSSYQDDLAWAAVWLYEATGEKNYLEDAKKFSDPNGTDNWTMCWDNMKTPVHLRLYACTKDETYLKAVKANIEYWLSSVQTTKGGLKYLNEWGVLRYAAAEAMIAMHYYAVTGDEKAKTLATSQIHYILGDNPNQMSYLIGYGNTYPLYPHHRAANGYTYANGGNLQPAQHLLLGALVGGPDRNDTYHDNGSEYRYSEVGIDYNAGFIGALVAMIDAGIMPSEKVISTSAKVSSASNTNTPSSSANVKKPEQQIEQNTISNNLLSVTLKNQIDSVVNQQYAIKAVSKEGIDLSKLKICYYYNKEDKVAQNFWCDHAGLQLNSEPWYKELTQKVKGTFYDDYLEITFDTQEKLQEGCTLTLGVRFAQHDWSAYMDFEDKGYQVYYNDQLLKE